jgi:hypothetical protein
MPEALVGLRRFFLKLGAADGNFPLPPGKNLAAGKGKGWILRIVTGKFMELFLFSCVRRRSN